MTEYSLISGFLGYINKKEITNVDEKYLLSGSINMLVDDALRVSTRNGYSLFGVEKTGYFPIRSSYEWTTSTASEIPLRSHNGDTGKLQYYAFGAWRTLKKSFNTRTKFSFDTWWDANENIDLLLFVNGQDKIYDWSGLVTKVASVTATTIKKMFFVSGTTFAFVAGNGTTVNPTITDSASGFVTAGFSAGDVIEVSGSTANSSIFTIASVTASTLTLIMSTTLTSEVAGPSVSIYVSGKSSWAEERALTAGTRKIVINDVEYTYTGGENTAELTGVTPSPVTNAVANGDVAIQAVRENTSVPIAGYKCDAIRVLLNQAYVLSRTSREVYVSKQSDFSDFGFTTPVRKPGEGAMLTLDDVGIGIESQEEDMYISSGKNDWYKTNFTLSSDGVYETLTVKKLKTSPQQGAISEASVAKLKNSIVFISNEPTLDELGRVEQINTPQSVPLSDPIKNDFDVYDFTDCHVKYHRSVIYIALPNEGKVLMYDIQSQFWQPPQILPVSRFAIINGEIYGHSNFGDETYKLFDGFDDNGYTFEYRAHFSYRNYGERTKLKTFDKYYMEAYMSSNSKPNVDIYTDYNGSTTIHNKIFDASDEGLVFGTSDVNDSLGSNPLGTQPLGYAISTLPENVDGLDKYRVVFGVTNTDFFEHQVVVHGDGLNEQVKIIAHGGNVKLSTNKPTFIAR